ncbi:hypothetical protein BU24DRAFT_46813 [Aaosphaeria arxii CBS 175.79]|uniref:Uncharacterized protein n=1 Tax=Aaosphaeria arxii CBS 175.79 TaxID=1450172 RepID=A0A6A5XD52_9PLEO|nr:uncharacterized protein BU24DRAFT_46813 [Aaosphaeria arxii CBS 175.79]KAF2010831.1 hypothetical protein BU24DRAFT_46813 [Aaosphaeria arxii CBS 175.79]
MVDSTKDFSTTNYARLDRVCFALLCLLFACLLSIVNSFPVCVSHTDGELLLQVRSQAVYIARRFDPSSGRRQPSARQKTRQAPPIVPQVAGLLTGGRGAFVDVWGAIRGSNWPTKSSPGQPNQPNQPNRTEADLPYQTTKYLLCVLCTK